MIRYQAYGNDFKFQCLLEILITKHSLEFGIKVWIKCIDIKKNTKINI